MQQAICRIVCHAVWRRLSFCSLLIGIVGIVVLVPHKRVSAQSNAKYSVRQWQGRKVNPSISQTNWSTNTGEVDADYVSFTANSANIGNGSLTTPFDYLSDIGTVSCESGSGFTSHSKGSHTKSIDFDTSAGCKHLYGLCNGYDQNKMWQQLYDTAKKMIETCPNIYRGYNAFLWMSEAAQNLGDTGQLRDDYFNWLKSVLYLNTTDPDYFCACAEAIAGQLPYPPGRDTIEGWMDIQGINYPLAVYRWIILNTGCDQSRALWGHYLGARQEQLDIWRSDSEVGIHYPLDTTLPPLSMWGLDTLFARQNQLSVGKSAPDRFSDFVSAFSVSENPLMRQTTLRMTLSQDAYVQIAVYDELGDIVFGEGSGHVYGAGRSEVPLDLSRTPSGAYYLRLSLGTGEVRSIKLIKR